MLLCYKAVAHLVLSCLALVCTASRLTVDESADGAVNDTRGKSDCDLQSAECAAVRPCNPCARNCITNSNCEAWLKCCKIYRVVGHGHQRCKNLEGVKNKVCEEWIEDGGYPLFLAHRKISKLYKEARDLAFLEEAATPVIGTLMLGWSLAKDYLQDWVMKENSQGAKNARFMAQIRREDAVWYESVYNKAAMAKALLRNFYKSPEDPASIKDACEKSQKALNAVSAADTITSVAWIIAAMAKEAVPGVSASKGMVNWYFFKKHSERYEELDSQFVSSEEVEQRERGIMRHLVLPEVERDGFFCPV